MGKRCQSEYKGGRGEGEKGKGKREKVERSKGVKGAGGRGTYKNIGKLQNTIGKSGIILILG